jgi:hypothetical protein
MRRTTEAEQQQVKQPARPVDALQDLHRFAVQVAEHATGSLGPLTVSQPGIEPAAEQEEPPECETCC